MKKNDGPNEGGVNGLGESLVNTRSQDFLALKEMIKSNYAKQSERENIENGLLSVRFQMESYLSSSSHDVHIESGEFIERLLRVVNVKKKRLAEYIDYEYSNFIALIKGRRKINVDVAIKLGQIFKIDPAIWLHIESKNELSRNLVQDNNSKVEVLSLNGLLQRSELN